MARLNVGFEVTGKLLIRRAGRWQRNTHDPPPLAISESSDCFVLPKLKQNRIGIQQIRQENEVSK